MLNVLYHSYLDSCWEKKYPQANNNGMAEGVHIMCPCLILHPFCVQVVIFMKIKCSIAWIFAFKITYPVLHNNELR